MKSYTRVESLDYLRGAMACFVMLYHYLSWSSYQPYVDAQSLIGKLGVYAVSIFYILSGLSLSIVYSKRITKLSDCYDFYIKRVFRIFPLFWFAISLAILILCFKAFLKNESLDLSYYDVLINYTLIFGFIDHDNYLTTGAWSIGNEMVFYSILPFIYLLAKRFKFLLLSVFIISLVIAIYFCFYKLNSNESLEIPLQWSNYINPLNQFFLFFGGALIGEFAKKNVFNILILYFILTASVVIFILIPVSSDQISIVTGYNRLILSFCSLFIVASIYCLNPEVKGLLAKFLSNLGQSCYSIYLLHPIVISPFLFLSLKYNVPTVLAVSFCIPLTIVISNYTFKYLEQPSINAGKFFSKKFSSKV